MNKSKQSVRHVTIKREHTISNFLDDNNENIDEFQDDNETFEEYIQRLKNTQRTQTPLVESIWSDDLINARNEQNAKKELNNKINFKFGSYLSEDGRFAMLKTYEDMLYMELTAIYPDLNLRGTLVRTNTEFFKHLPANQNTPKLPMIKGPVQAAETQNKTRIKTGDSLYSNSNVDKFNCSKELEKAMKIYDSIRLKKGELTTSSDKPKINNLIGAYDSWKKNCYNRLIKNKV